MIGRLIRSTRMLLVGGTLSLACGVPAHAQDDSTRRGFWLSGDLGYGSAHVSCETCLIGPHLDGLDVLLGVGGTPSPRVRLGGVLEVWQHPLGDGETFQAITTITASLYYYPRIRSGVFFEGGIGHSDYRVVKGPLREGFLFENAQSPVGGSGWGATVGLGYDIRVSQGFSIGPRVAATLRWRRHAPFSPRSAAGERMDAERAFARRAHNTKPVVEVITRAPRSMVGIVRATIHEPRRSHAAA